SNPLLEAGELVHERPQEAEVREEAPEDPSADQLIARGQGEADAPLDIDPAAMDRDRDTGDWAANGGSGAEEAPSIDERAGEGATLAQHLEAQIGAVIDDPRVLFVARHLIGLLDEAGYLAAPLREVADDLGVPLSWAEEALARVQSLDPTGVGARTLAECLALQAREADRYDPCMARLIDNLESVARGDFARLKRLCAVDDEDFADMLAELRSYDPKPGLRFGGGERQPVVPDVLVTGDAKSGWDIALNQATLPRLVVNRSYYVELRRGSISRQTRTWLSERLSEANSLIKALDQRQKTILKVAAEIVKQQEGFFRCGVSHLRPLTLRTVAEAIEMHESTVSRVTSNKYLNCGRGTFELKYFFTSGVASADGEGAVSAE